MKFNIRLQGKEYEVEISPANGRKTRVRIGEEDFFFEEKERERASVAKPSLPRKDFKKKEIKAPIAGTVSDLFVKEGEAIKKGKKVLLLSAMKMENEIISDFGGKIKELKVKKDQKVKEGDTLLILE